jgi:hypothetical protein
VYDLLLSIAQTSEFFDSYILQSIFTAKYGYSFRTKMLIKGKCDLIEGGVLKIIIDVDGIDGKFLALKGNLQGPRILK